MSLEVGAIVEGEVTGITNFGAFVQLPEGKVGLIHISEVSNVYVKKYYLLMRVEKSGCPLNSLPRRRHLSLSRSARQ